MRTIGCFLFALAAVAMPVRAAEYDPLSVPDRKVVSETREIRDAKRDRIIPVRVYLPEKKPAAVVMFSHGLGGSRDGNAWLGEHWAKRGYFVVFLQHPGSDESVWKGAPVGSKMMKLKTAATFDNLKLRGGDVGAVLDALEGWNKDGEWEGRMDLKHVAITGHSFGAHTTQAVAGQQFAGGRISFLEPRVSAAIMMSPSPPAVGDPAEAFAPVRIPCLLMTGTEDDSPIGKVTPAERLMVFPHLKNAPAWQVVYDGANHGSFGGRGKGPEAARYKTATLALTTAFLDTHLRENASAGAWLNGKGAKSVLVEKDRWERNEKTN